MTVCISAICNGGKEVIIASDRKITGEHLSIEFEHPAAKFCKLSSCCVAATAGDALVHSELFDKVKPKIDDLKAPYIKEIVKKIKQSYEIRPRILRGLERSVRPADERPFLLTY